MPEWLWQSVNLKLDIHPADEKSDAPELPYGYAPASTPEGAWHPVNVSFPYVLWRRLLAQNQNKPA